MKIFVVSIARTGSQYLMDLLKTYAEQLGMIRLSEPFSYTNMSKYDLEYSTKIVEIIEELPVLLKTHINQLNRLDKKLIDRILNNNMYTIILLRKDLFGCVVSHALADALGQFSEYTYDASLRIEINEAEFINLINMKINCWEQIAEFNCTNTVNELLYYEDFKFVHADDFNHLKLQELYKTTFDRQYCVDRKSPNNFEIITNYDKLKNIFNVTMENFTHPLINNTAGFLELK